MVRLRIPPTALGAPPLETLGVVFRRMVDRSELAFSRSDARTPPHLLPAGLENAASDDVISSLINVHPRATGKETSESTTQIWERHLCSLLMPAHQRYSHSLHPSLTLTSDPLTSDPDLPSRVTDLSDSLAVVPPPALHIRRSLYSCLLNPDTVSRHPGRCLGIPPSRPKQQNSCSP